jgi:hypothetical protein
MVVKVLAVILGAYLVLFAALGAAIYATGLIVVDVKDKVHNHRVLVPVPMLLVHTAVSLVPDHLMKQADVQKEVDMKWVHAAAEALADCPDATFVDVRTKRESVTVAKKGGNLTLNVDTRDEQVYMRFPIRGMERVVAQLAAAGR